MNLQGTTMKVFFLLVVLVMFNLTLAYTSDISVPEEDPDNSFEFLIDNLRFTASPNPFEDYTVITTFVSESIRATITIKDRNGNTLNNLYNGSLKQGSNQVVWYGVDDAGIPLDPDSYICELGLENRYTSRTIILILK